MNTELKAFSVLCFLLLISTTASFAQKPSKEWTLRNCIDYALLNNIQIKQMQVGVSVEEAVYEQSKSARIPSLNAAASESFTHQQPLQGDQSSQESSLTGNYSLNSDVTLFNGSRIKNTIAQQEISVKSATLGVIESQNNIELAVTTAYLQILYAREAVVNAENTLTSSDAQLSRTKILYEAGYIAESNYAQVQSQHSTDSYALVTAKNDLSKQFLTLKQLLELGIEEELKLYFPEMKDSEVIRAIQPKQDVYNTALGFMPEIENGKLSINAAEFDIKIAKAGYLPSLSLSASASTGYSNAVSNGFATQLGNNFYQNAGLNLSIPIFNNKQVKTSISKARLGMETAQLDYLSTQKDLLNRVESAYLDAVSAQSRFLSANEQLTSTKKSYTLVEEQFNLGMKNTVELLTEKTKYLSAQQEYLQAKYTAILNIKILDFYQQKRIEL
jgi:outer membrane protein